MLVGGQVVWIGAMEDERCNRGPKGMGWGWGHVGQGCDMCEGVGMWADGYVGGRIGRWHVGRVGVSMREA